MSRLQHILSVSSVFLSFSIAAEVIRAFRCIGASIKNKDEIEILYKQRPITKETYQLQVDVKLNSNKATWKQLKSQASFYVSQNEDEVLFTKLEKQEDVWIVDTQRGSSVKQQELLNKDHSYQFYVKNPKAGVDNLIIELNKVENTKNPSNSFAEVYVHKTGSDPDYLGRFGVHCETKN